MWRRADSFGPPDGVGARSDIQDILDGAVASLLLEMSATEFTARHVFDQYRVYEGSGRLRGVRWDGPAAQELIDRRRHTIACPEHRFLDRMRSPFLKVASESRAGIHSPSARQRPR